MGKVAKPAFAVAGNVVTWGKDTIDLNGLQATVRYTVQYHPAGKAPIMPPNADAATMAKVKAEHAKGVKVLTGKDKAETLALRAATLNVLIDGKYNTWKDAYSIACAACGKDSPQAARIRAIWSTHEEAKASLGMGSGDAAAVDDIDLFGSIDVTPKGFTLPAPAAPAAQAAPDVATIVAAVLAAMNTK